MCAEPSSGGSSGGAKSGEASSSAVRARALRQVEYYLSDESLPFDEYLKSKCDESGWLSIEEVAGFPKMVTITKDVEEVVAALQESDQLEVSEGKVRRRYPTPDKDPNAERTVHASGFKCAESSASEIEGRVRAALEKHGAIEAVRALRNVTQDTRALDGSAFCVFSEASAAQLAASATGFVHEGRKITVYGMADWFERLGKKRASMRKKKDEKKSPPEEAAKTPDENAILSFAGVPEGVSREDLRALVEPHATVRYVEFERGQSTAYVRLDAGRAPVVLDALGEAVKLGDSDAVALAVLQGDDEQAYWQRADESFKNRKRRSSAAAGQRKRGRR